MIVGVQSRASDIVPGCLGIMARSSEEIALFANLSRDHVTVDDALGDLLQPMVVRVGHARHDRHLCEDLSNPHQFAVRQLIVAEGRSEGLCRLAALFKELP
mgnify:CR=1 FL=1